jgi:hypothetical protein
MHYTCLVIGDDVRRQMAPYNCGYYPSQPYTVVRSTAVTYPPDDELLYRCCDEQLRKDYRERAFRDIDTDYCDLEEWSDTAYVIQGQHVHAKPEWVGKRPCDLWDDFDDYATNFLGLIPDASGQYGYWHIHYGFWTWYGTTSGLPLKRVRTPDPAPSRPCRRMSGFGGLLTVDGLPQRQRRGNSGRSAIRLMGPTNPPQPAVAKVGMPTRRRRIWNACWTRSEPTSALIHTYQARMDEVDWKAMDIAIHYVIVDRDLHELYWDAVASTEDVRGTVASITLDALVDRRLWEIRSKTAPDALVTMLHGHGE